MVAIRTIKNLEDLKSLRDQIDEVLKEPKATIRVWNPRSRKHDIIEQ